MLYAIACPRWEPGDPFLPASARGGLFRTRAEARGAVGAGPMVALAVRYDEARGMLVPQGPVAAGRAPGWLAPAIVNDLGGLTAFGAIPIPLVREIPPAEIRADAGTLRPLLQLHRPPRAARRDVQTVGDGRGMAGVRGRGAG